MGARRGNVSVRCRVRTTRRVASARASNSARLMVLQGLQNQHVQGFRHRRRRWWRRRRRRRARTRPCEASAMLKDTTQGLHAFHRGVRRLGQLRHLLQPSSHAPRIATIGMSPRQLALAAIIAGHPVCVRCSRHHQPGWRMAALPLSSAPTPLRH